MIPVRVSRNVVLMQRRFSATAWNKDTAYTTPGPPVLPDLPPPVKGWPSFWMIRKEAEEYLYPLYARGWGVKFIPRWGHTSKHVRLIHQLPIPSTVTLLTVFLQDLYVAHLTTDLSFANFNCAVQFITDLKKMSNEEKVYILSLQDISYKPNKLFTSIILPTSPFKIANAQIYLCTSARIPLSARNGTKKTPKRILPSLAVFLVSLAVTFVLPC